MGHLLKRNRYHDGLLRSDHSGEFMRPALRIAAAPMALALTSAAYASTIDLTFENIAPYPNSNNVLIENYYDGGTSSIGTTGPNFGVTFSSNALLICLNTLSTDSHHEAAWVIQIRNLELCSSYRVARRS